MIDCRYGIIAAAALALVACEANSPVADQVSESAAEPETPVADQARTAEIEDAIAARASVDGRIPEPLHGRWGLTPAACEAPPGRAEGLLIVTGEDLRFYESRAEPLSNIEASGNSISGEFTFTGEGQTERRFQSLQLQDDQLVRTGNGPAGSFTYVRCEPQR